MKNFTILLILFLTVTSQNVFPKNDLPIGNNNLQELANNYQNFKKYKIFIGKNNTSDLDYISFLKTTPNLQESSESNKYKNKKNQIDYYLKKENEQIKDIVEYQDVQFNHLTDNEKLQISSNIRHFNNPKNYIKSIIKRRNVFRKEINNFIINGIDYHNVLEIFCSSMAPGYKKYNFKNQIKSTLNDNKAVCKLLSKDYNFNDNRYITEDEKFKIDSLISDLNKDFSEEIKINISEQKYELCENKLYSINGTKETVVDSGRPFLNKFFNNLYPDSVKLSTDFKSCYHTEKSYNEAQCNENQIGDCELYKIENLVNEDNSIYFIPDNNIESQLNEKLNIREKSWKCYPSINNNKKLNISLETIYIDKDNSSHFVTPTYSVSCVTKGTWSLKVSINALNGRLLIDSNKFQSIDFNHKKNIYIHLDLTTSTSENRNSPYAWKIDKNTELLPLQYKTNNNKFIFSDTNPCEMSPKSKEANKYCNAYIHLDRFQRLMPKISQKSITHDFPLKKINIDIKDSLCNKRIAYAYNNNSLCLGGENDLFTAFDSTIISHELSHFIVKDIQKFTNPFSTQDFKFLFHDLADSLSITYNNNSCIGKYMGKDYKCIKANRTTENPSSIPRKIDTYTSYLNRITQDDEIYFQKGDYFRGQMTARMFQIIHELFNKNSPLSEYYPNNDVIGTLKHWIRLSRTLAIYNYVMDPCIECEYEFYLAQQNLMRSYLIQLIQSSDINLVSKLIYNWSLEGYSLRDISCIDTYDILTGTCFINIMDRIHTIVPEYYGISEGSVIGEIDKSLSIGIKTGLNYSFDVNKKVHYNNNCNKSVNITFYANENSTIKPFNYKQISKNNSHLLKKYNNLSNSKYFTEIDEQCNLNFNLGKPEFTKILIENGKSRKPNEIYFLIETCMLEKESCEGGILNLLYKKQELPTLKI